MAAACGSVPAMSHIGSLRAERFAPAAGNFNFLKQMYWKEPTNANVDHQFSAADAREGRPALLEGLRCSCRKMGRKPGTAARPGTGL